MTLEGAQQIIVYLWLVIAVVWLLAAFAVKPAAQTQSGGWRALHMLLAVSAYVIGFSRRFTFGVLARPFVPASPTVVYCALTLTAAGIGFAIWARFFLGGNWSGRVTLKEGHTLVRRGPYAIVRHPIYSGLLLAVLGTAVAYRQFRGLVALAIVGGMLVIKLRAEETLMTGQFGAQYEDYKQQVKALIPFVY